jgi:hypothetical protein
MKLLFLLLVIYQLKHFLCDYPLQTAYMLGKFKGGNQWIGPLFAHAGAHAFATLLIALCFAPAYGIAILLALFDFAAHFSIDRLKVLKGSYPMADKRFWWALGADQMAHHFTHYSITAILLWLK